MTKPKTLADSPTLSCKVSKNSGSGFMTARQLATTKPKASTHNSTATNKKTPAAATNFFSPKKKPEVPKPTKKPDVFIID